jgi:signal transduction histidine kinase
MTRAVMLRRLHLRMLFLFAVLLIPAGTLLVATSLRGARRYHQEIVQRQNLALAQNLVHESDGIGLANAQTGGLPDLVKMLAMANPGVEIYVLDDELRVVQGPANVALAATSVRGSPLDRFAAAAAGADATYPILGTDPRRGGDVVFSAAPLPSGDGWLYVVLTDASRASLARSVQTSTTLSLLLWSAGLGLALLLATGFVSFSLLTRRLRRLAQAVGRFQLDGDGEDLARPVAHRDEIDELQTGFADLAHRARTQYRELARADLRRRELVTNVSHDLRTPLTALQGYLEAMDEADAARARGYLASARRSAARLGHLIDQLFELSRLEGETDALRREPFPPAELVSDVAQKFALAAERKGVGLGVEAEADVPFVRGDLGAIERALSNLLENALRHTPAGGHVRVTVSATGDAVEIAVADTGPGVPAGAEERVFERFFRVEEGRSGEGSGLGLAIARRVVELHGGTIRAERAEEGGARFRFTLPVDARRPAHPSAGPL